MTFADQDEEELRRRRLTDPCLSLREYLEYYFIISVL